MSNKTLAPKLRFPEFLESGEWDKKPLRMVANVIAGQSPDGSNYNDKGIGTPFYQGKTDFGDVYINSPTKWTTQVTKIAESGDILISVRAPVGALNICVGQICIGRGLAAIQAKQNKWYLYYFLNRIQKSIVGNGGAIFDAINKDQIEEITTFIPSPPEQQKIADCLTALDALIAAECAQLDALKTYKKGLLQNLFPAEGESLPKLRFPEFQSAGEWETKRLIDTCVKITQGGTPDTSKPNYWNGSIEWLTPAEMGNIETRFIDSTSRKITEEGFRNCSSDLLPINSVIISTRAPIGHLAINKSPMAINQGCKGLVPNESTDYNFLYYSLLNAKPFLIDLGAGNTFKELSGSSLKNFEAPFPDFPEQQKIAEMLTSLDEAIAAQSGRVAGLGVHKQGLLQGLFPPSSPTLSPQGEGSLLSPLPLGEG